MENNVYKKAVHNGACAFAYHEAVFDAAGKMVDYIFLDVNSSFEELTGLKRKDILGKHYVRDIAKNKKDAKRWTAMYATVIAEQKTIEFEEFSAELDRHYFVKASPAENNRFVTLFDDTTFESKLQEISGYLISSPEGIVDYDRITQFALDVSGAAYAAFNLVDENSKNFTTVSVTGISENIKKALRMLHFDVTGKTWAYDAAKEEHTKGSDITHFKSLHVLTGEVITKNTILQIEKVFGLGEVVVAKIRKEEKVLGDFTLLYKKEEHLKNRELMLLYLSLLGLFLEKNRISGVLRSNRRMFYILAEYAPVGFLSCTAGGEVLYANKKLLEIMGSPSLDATKSINLLTFPKLVEAGFSGKLKECIEKERNIEFEMEYTSLWGKTSWLRVHFTPNRDEQHVSGANIVLNDITKSKNSEEALKEIAHRDALTKAYNRNVLDTVLADRLYESKSKGFIGCFAVVDVDGFKSINDTYGHKAGDSVLKHLAANVKEILRENDMVVRTGGDEFLIYLHDVKDKDNAQTAVKRLFDAVSGEYLLEKDAMGPAVRLHVRCSIGASLFPEDGKTVETLMAKADDALYAVKKSGKADVRFAGD